MRTDARDALRGLTPQCHGVSFDTVHIPCGIRVFGKTKSNHIMKQSETDTYCVMRILFFFGGGCLVGLSLRTLTFVRGNVVGPWSFACLKSSPFFRGGGQTQCDKLYVRLWGDGSFLGHLCKIPSPVNFEFPRGSCNSERQWFRIFDLYGTVDESCSNHP